MKQVVEMTGIERLKDWFRSGQLVRPSSHTLNFVDLVRALAHLAGAKGVQIGPGVQELCRKIGPARHYVFVLIDGMGSDQVKSLPEATLLRRCTVEQLQAVFPSTTATAFTTLATGRWPCSHGVPGWWTYLERTGINAVTLPFKERSTEKPLDVFGLGAKDLFPLPSLWPGLKYEPLTLLPADIAHSTYSKYASGGTARIGYPDLADAFDIAVEAVLNATGPSLTHIYLPQLDALSHTEGPGNQKVRDLLLTVDRHLLHLVESLAGQARVVISADHGQTKTTEQHNFILLEDDAILSHLHCYPSGEPTVPIFHVRQGHEALFAAEFTERFGQSFTLITPEEIEHLRLLGPTNLSQVMKQRLGTFVGIAKEPATICVASQGDCGSRNIGVHGGLSSAEMHVPLILP